MLATDLDGTVVPPSSIGPRVGGVDELATALTGRGDLILAYVTGRHLALALEGIGEHGLPTPDVLVCDVGTSVYQNAGGAWKADPEYARRMLAAGGGTTSAKIREALAAVEGLEPQEPEKQAEFKVSYYYSGPARRHVLSEAASRLEGAGALVGLVHSLEVGSGRGLLDVLPAGVAKDYAVRYLRERSGVDDDTLVYAGDSGNDLAVFLAGCRSVVVGNAEEAFKAEARAAVVAAGLEDRVYFARESYGHGVLEGCRHFGLL